MPPKKPNYGKAASKQISGAASSKVQSLTGAKVTTVVTSSKATAQDSPIVSLEIESGGKAGFGWGDGGKVSAVNRGGLADKARVKLTHRLVRVGANPVEACTSKAEIEALLVAAREAGAYSVTFAAPGADISSLLQAEPGAPSKTESESDAAAADTRYSTDKEGADRAEENADGGASAETAGNLDASAEDAATAAVEEAAQVLQAENEAAEAAAKAAEEKAAAAAAAEIAAAKAAAAAEIERLKQEARNGDVVVLYNMYKDPFSIKDGMLTAAAIDEEYCLSDAMPGCQIHLSRISPEEFTQFSQPSEMGPSFEVKYEREEPWGTFQDLDTRRKYHVWVVQDKAAEERDRAKMKDQWERMAVQAAAEAGPRTEETCSCIEGNPCVDPYICLDWYNRITVAKAHGFKAGADTRCL